MDHARGYQAIDELLDYAARLAVDLDDQSLGHGIIDLARSARKEIQFIGLTGGAKQIPQNSYEGLLLYQLLPEVAHRLMSRRGITVLRLPEERPDADIASANGDRIRILVGNCMENASFDLIAEKVRDRFDPSYRNTKTFFACEAIDRNPLEGNLIEIATTRVQPATALGQDYFSRLFSLSHRLSDTHRGYSWLPAPENTQDISNISTLEVSY